MDDWFRWEREATIHLLFPTLEGSMKPLEEFSGHGFPTTILIFKSGIVTWCVKNSEFYGLGAKLLQIYKNEKKEQEMIEEASKRLAALKQIEVEIKDVTISELTDSELTNIYAKLHDAFINYYGIGAIQEPLAMQAEEELKKISNLSHDEIAHLVAPTKLSYIQEADNYLLETKDIDGFIEKYYWIDNNYSQTKVLTKENVEKRLADIKLVQPSPNSSSSELELESQRLVQLLKNFATYQDDRKRNILEYLHYLEVLLKEVGKRGGITLSAMRDIFPHEIQDILEGKIAEDFIKQRREKCFVVWKEKAEKPEILVGDEAKEWEQTLAPQASSSQIVKGNCASKGRVTGKVRVLLNASENDHLEDGEVLVTFMTSPDFMSAVRRCSAIVTNLGGITSHAAIISRELGIPCIVGTKNATEALKTGVMVEVDADKGEVKIL